MKAIFQEHVTSENVPTFYCSMIMMEVAMHHQQID